MSEEQTSSTTETTESTTTAADLSSMLSEGVKGDPSLVDFKDVDSLAKSYISAQKMIGSSVRIPGDDAGKEDLESFYSKLDKVPGVMRAPDNDNKEAMDQFYTRMGRPETVDKYEFSLDENTNIDKDIYNKFKDLAFQQGLTNKQAKAIVEHDLALSKEQTDSASAQLQECEKQLRDSWGHEYDNRVASAKAIANKYGEKYPEAVKELVDGPMGRNPAVISMMAELGKSMQEKGVPDINSGVKFGVSSDEAKLQIAEIRGNKEHPFHKQMDPSHKAATEKVMQLYKLAYPSQDKG